MTDIVERLRNWEHIHPEDEHLEAGGLYIVAADEIEDLRYQLTFEEASRINAFMELEKQDAEIKRLRSEVLVRKSFVEEARNERDKLRVILEDGIAWCNRNDEDPWWLEIAKEALEET